MIATYNIHDKIESWNQHTKVAQKAGIKSGYFKQSKGASDLFKLGKGEKLKTKAAIRPKKGELKKTANAKRATK